MHIEQLNSRTSASLRAGGQWRAHRSSDTELAFRARLLSFLVLIAVVNGEEPGTSLAAVERTCNNSKHLQVVLLLPQQPSHSQTGDFAWPDQASEEEPQGMLSMLRIALHGWLLDSAMIKCDDWPAIAC